MAFSAGAAQAGGVEHIVVNGNQVIVDVAQVRSVSTRILANPPRIALDFSGSSYGRAAVGDGPVSAVRVGQYGANVTRVVLDLDSPMLETAEHFSPDGKQFSLTLQPTDTDNYALFANGAAKKILAPGAAWFPPPRAGSSIAKLTPAGAPLPRPHIYGPAGRPLVVIDPGHGGQDPGAINPVTGQREKDVTLATAKKIRDVLLASGRVRVALTREDDHFIILRERSAIARNLGANLFISIHADSEPGSDAHGATVYTLSETASDKEAQALAARENKADIVHGVNLNGESADVTSILLDLAQRETMN
ncbi:MAG: N-acetylmuramoyl-L-alanine amidase, partial [Alphaproteobacteria bacterium]|nr:N-acetylmuramoyl-L-alanine amidase [Alphaproteobacteria bacterium]